MTAPALNIRIKKNADGSAALTLTRADGSVTWQRQEGPHGRFFPLHDLTHYAVETVLRHERGFYGMVASGWDISDWGHPWPKGYPESMDPSELIVGFLDAERASGEPTTADEFNEKARIHLQDHNQWLRQGPVSMTDDELTRIREVRDALFMRWSAVRAGDALELRFPE